MNIINKTGFVLITALAFGTASLSAVAEVAPAASVSGVSETVAHIEKALVEISKSDFSAAQVHLKAARYAGEKITGNAEKVKQANALVIQGQIKAKLGDVKNSTEELNKALAVYKAL